MTSAGRLRQLLAKNKVTVTAGVHDALGARILQDSGFELAYMSGNATSASKLGRPDIGLLTMTEMIDTGRYIAHSIDIPLICDSDTAYGSEDNIVRAVREWEKAGVAAIHIEDQVADKRCGAMPGLKLVDVEEAVTRIQTAAQAKTDPDFMIIARTDAIPVFGLGEAITRAHRFLEAGADMIYIEDFQNRDQIEAVGHEFRDVPLMCDVAEPWPWTLIPYAELGDMGFNVVFYCLSATFAYTKTLRKVFRTIREEGTTTSILADFEDFGEYQRILGIDQTMIRRR